MFSLYPDFLGRLQPSNTTTQKTRDEKVEKNRIEGILVSNSSLVSGLSEFWSQVVLGRSLPESLKNLKARNSALIPPAETLDPSLDSSLRALPASTRYYP